jgi:hypothetical protein
MRFGIGGVCTEETLRPAEPASASSHSATPSSARRRWRASTCSATAEVDSMHADDFDAQMEPFLAAIEEYGSDRADALPAGRGLTCGR